MQVNFVVCIRERELSATNKLGFTPSIYDNCWAYFPALVILRCFLNLGICRFMIGGCNLAWNS